MWWAICFILIMLIYMPRLMFRLLVMYSILLKMSIYKINIYYYYYVDQRTLHTEYMRQTAGTRRDDIWANYIKRCMGEEKCLDISH